MWLDGYLPGRTRSVVNAGEGSTRARSKGPRPTRMSVVLDQFPSALLASNARALPTASILTIELAGIVQLASRLVFTRKPPRRWANRNQGAWAPVGKSALPCAVEADESVKVSLKATSTSTRGYEPAAERSVWRILRASRIARVRRSVCPCRTLEEGRSRAVCQVTLGPARDSRHRDSVGMMSFENP